MAGQPFDWNIIINGAWNVAILTPVGVAEKLFGLEPGTPLSVEVPMDRQAPLRITHSNVVVVPSGGRLAIAPTDADAEALCNAARIAQKAIAALPETPVTAAGVNFRFRFDEIPPRLLEMLVCRIDDQLSDDGFAVSSKSLKRSITWRQGILNVEIEENADTTCVVGLNFHRQSQQSNELDEWLAQVDEMAASASRFMIHTLRTQINGNQDD